MGYIHSQSAHTARKQDQLGEALTVLTATLGTWSNCVTAQQEALEALEADKALFSPQQWDALLAHCRAMGPEAEAALPQLEAALCAPESIYHSRDQRELLLAYEGYLEAETRYVSYLLAALLQEMAQAQQAEVLAAMTYMEALAGAQTVTLEESLEESLQAVGISPAEYELFANSRPSNLQTIQARLSALCFYLDHAEEQADARENLRFCLTADQAEQDSLRGYYYYGCYNYWFPEADEAELALLEQWVTEKLAAYCPPDAALCRVQAAVEQRVTLYLDQVEAVVDLSAELNAIVAEYKALTAEETP